MSRLTDLLAQVGRLDADLARDLSAEVKSLKQLRSFGLNFERHQPEAVELPGRRPVRGDKVRVLPERGSTAKADGRIWQLQSTDAEWAVLVAPGQEEVRAPLADLVVVSEFRDPIYPGLRQSDEPVRRGALDKPAHTVINAENFHALEALTWTHEGKVDAIYIDPPYNTGAKDWKYNNDYVDSDDDYRHSKWLAMMERRLLLAKRLLNPDNSVLIVTIDEHEVHRLRELLEQAFPESVVQMVTVVINPKGVAQGRFARVEEYALYCFLGSAAVRATRDDLLSDASTQRNTRFWKGLLRAGTNARPSDGLGMSYPLIVDQASSRLVRAGRTLRERIAFDELVGDPNRWIPDATSEPHGTGEVVVWPLRADGSLGVWQAVPPTLMSLADEGFVKCVLRAEGWAISYVPNGVRRKIDSGEVAVVGCDPVSGSALLEMRTDLSRAKTVWKRAAHDAGWHGSVLVKTLLVDRKFPFPKSLYVVEDALRPVLIDKPDAVVLDFFAGSGTTAHAVMRLNKQDGGSRQCISVTNNEVGADEQKKLREQGLRPGDPEWEQWGICDYVTKPRIRAAATGKTPDGVPIKGDYKFTDEFPMADGFEENVEFFTLTYEQPRAIQHGAAFASIAPMLWLRAGAQGRRIEQDNGTYDVADTYGVLFGLDSTAEFVATLNEQHRLAYIVGDDERAFQMVCAELPDHVEPVRLYESYLANFRIGNAG